VAVVQYTFTHKQYTQHTNNMVTLNGMEINVEGKMREKM
jgi:hypothetical protein